AAGSGLQPLQDGRGLAALFRQVAHAQAAHRSERGLGAGRQRGDHHADAEDGDLDGRQRSHLSRYLNSSLTLRFSWTRMMASASSGATDSTVTGGPCFSGGTGIELVTTSSSMGAARRRSTAPGVSTGCVAANTTRRAPCAFRATATSTAVPPV